MKYSAQLWAKNELCHALSLTFSSLKYVDILPCNLSLIPCLRTLMFHEVVWQQMLGVVGFLITILLQIY